MYKWVYDRMIEEYKKESKEELINRLMAESEIEVEDRSFANQCYAGTSIYDINELFSALEDLQNGFTYEKAAKVYELAEQAKGSWNYIKSGLSEMKQDTRSGKKLEDFKKRVSMAKDKNDCI